MLPRENNINQKDHKLIHKKMKLLLISFESVNDSINNAASILAQEIQEIVSSSLPSSTKLLDGPTTASSNNNDIIFPDNVEIVTHVLKCQFNKLTVLAAKLKVDVHQPDAVLFVTADNSNIKKQKASIVRFHKTSDNTNTNNVTDSKQYVGRGRIFSSSSIHHSTTLFNSMKKSLKNANVPYQVTDIDDTEYDFLKDMNFINVLGWIRLPSYLKENKPSRNTSYMSIEKSARAVLAGLYGMTMEVLKVESVTTSTQQQQQLPSDVSAFLDNDWYYTLILRLRFCYQWKSLKSNHNHKEREKKEKKQSSPTTVKKNNKEKENKETKIKKKKAEQQKQRNVRVATFWPSTNDAEKQNTEVLVTPSSPSSSPTLSPFLSFTFDDSSDSEEENDNEDSKKDQQKDESMMNEDDDDTQIEEEKEGVSHSLWNELMQQDDDDTETNSNTLNELLEEYNNHTKYIVDNDNTETSTYNNNNTESSGYWNEEEITESSSCWNEEDITESSSCWNEEDITESSCNEYDNEDEEDDSWTRLYKIIEEEEGEIHEENIREEASNIEKEEEEEKEKFSKEKEKKMIEEEESNTKKEQDAGVKTETEALSNKIAEEIAKAEEERTVSLSLSKKDRDEEKLTLSNKNDDDGCIGSLDTTTTTVTVTATATATSTKNNTVDNSNNNKFIKQSHSPITMRKASSKIVNIEKGSSSPIDYCSLLKAGEEKKNDEDIQQQTFTIVLSNNIDQNKKNDIITEEQLGYAIVSPPPSPPLLCNSKSIYYGRRRRSSMPFVPSSTASAALHKMNHATDATATNTDNITTANDNNIAVNDSNNNETRNWTGRRRRLSMPMITTDERKRYGNHNNNNDNNSKYDFRSVLKKRERRNRKKQDLGIIVGNDGNTAEKKPIRQEKIIKEETAMTAAAGTVDNNSTLNNNHSDNNIGTLKVIVGDDHDYGYGRMDTNNVIRGAKGRSRRRLSMPLLHTTTMTTLSPPSDFRSVSKCNSDPIKNRNNYYDIATAIRTETDVAEGNHDSKQRCCSEKKIDVRLTLKDEGNENNTSINGFAVDCDDDMAKQQQQYTTTAKFSQSPNKDKAEERHIANGTKTKIGWRQSRRSSLPLISAITTTLMITTEDKKKEVSGNIIKAFDFRSVLKGKTKTKRNFDSSAITEQNSINKNSQPRNNKNNKVKDIQENSHLNVNIDSESLSSLSAAVKIVTTTAAAAATAESLKKEERVLKEEMYHNDYQQHHDNNVENITKVGKRRMRRRSTMPFAFAPTAAATTSSTRIQIESRHSKHDNKYMFDFRSVLKGGKKKGNNAFIEVHVKHQQSITEVPQNKEIAQEEQQKKQQQKWQHPTKNALYTTAKDEGRITYVSHRSSIAQDAVLERDNTSLTYGCNSNNNMLVIKGEIGIRGKKQRQKHQRIPFSKSNSESSLLIESTKLNKVEKNDNSLVELGYRISYAGDILLKEVNKGCDRINNYDIDNNNNKFAIKFQLSKIESGKNETPQARRSSTLPKKKLNNDRCTIQENHRRRERIENSFCRSSSNGNDLKTVLSAKEYLKSLNCYPPSSSPKKEYSNKNDGRQVEFAANSSILRSTDGIQYKDMEVFRTGHCASRKFGDKLQYFEKGKKQQQHRQLDEGKIIADLVLPSPVGRNSDRNDRKLPVVKQRRMMARRFSVI